MIGAGIGARRSRASTTIGSAGRHPDPPRHRRWSAVTSTRSALRAAAEPRAASRRSRGELRAPVQRLHPDRAAASGLGCPDRARSRCRSGGSGIPRLTARAARLALRRHLPARASWSAAARQSLRRGARDRVPVRSGFDYSPRVPRMLTLPLVHSCSGRPAGYCQQFAGAMGLMLRMVGIPSRVVSGFAPGALDQERGVYEVRDTDAHSWVEVYFRGIGWVTFDPTPGRRRPARQRLRRQLRRRPPRRRRRGGARPGIDRRIPPQRSAAGRPTGQSSAAVVWALGDHRPARARRPSRHGRSDRDRRLERGAWLCSPGNARRRRWPSWA